jgi:hypothetical protein
VHDRSGHCRTYGVRLHMSHIWHTFTYVVYMVYVYICRAYGVRLRLSYMWCKFTYVVQGMSV